MNESGTSVAPDDLARVDPSTSSNRFEGIPIWNWRPTLVSANNNVDDFRRRQTVAADHDYSSSVPFRQVENRRPSIHALHHNLTEMNSAGYSLDALPSATMMVNLLENRNLEMLYPRVVVVNHDRDRERVANNQNVFFDFFGGGDSPETIIEYYRRRILNAISTGRQLPYTEVQYVRAE